MSLRGLQKEDLLHDFSRLVDQDRQNTASLIAYIAEIDRRKLFLEHACSSMFTFCTERFGMSEAVAGRRIRAGRTTCRFPCVLDMIARGALHLCRREGSPLRVKVAGRVSPHRALLLRRHARTPQRHIAVSGA